MEKLALNTIHGFVTPDEAREMNHTGGEWFIDVQGGIAFSRPYGWEQYGIYQEEVDNVLEFHAAT